MDELAVAYVDTHMGDGAAVAEEDHIAHLQIILCHRRAVAPLGGGGVGQIVAKLPIDIHGEPGAVKAAAGSGAAVDVAAADQAAGVVHNFLLLAGQGVLRLD